ncbi:hypothetical protein ACP4OV_002272 [Aristida adscensionis]
MSRATLSALMAISLYILPVETGCAEAESLLKQKIDKLNLAVDSFAEIVREKEEFVSQIGLEAMEARLDSLCRELDLLRDKVGKQDSYISERSRQFDIIVGRLEQAQQHVEHNNVTLSELKDNFGTISDSVKKLEKQNQALHTVIEEKEKRLTSTVSKDNEFKECMKHVVESMSYFEKFIADQQTIVANKLQHSESRFCLLKEQCQQLAKEGSLLRKKALRYKEISETRGSNLQKAELEKSDWHWWRRPWRSGAGVPGWAPATAALRAPRTGGGRAMGCRAGRRPPRHSELTELGAARFGAGARREGPEARRLTAGRPRGRREAGGMRGRRRGRGDDGWPTASHNGAVPRGGAASDGDQEPGRFGAAGWRGRQRGKRRRPGAERRPDDSGAAGRDGGGECARGRQCARARARECGR